MQQAGLSVADWLRCAAVASSVLWLSELSNVVMRAPKRGGWLENLPKRQPRLAPGMQYA